LPGKTKTPRQRLCMMKRLYEIIGMLTISVATMLALLLLQLITAELQFQVFPIFLEAGH
jgi:hypothetical protein